MPIRVTHNMLNIQTLHNLRNSYSRISKLQEQLSSGRIINNPHDDPVGITHALRFRGESNVVEQFKKNVDMARSWLETTDSALNQATEVLQRIRELAVQGANDPNPQTAFEAIKEEVQELYDQLVQIANSQFAGKYIFNGQLTDVKPYDGATAPTVTTDTMQVRLEISQGMMIDVSVTGNQVFGAPGDADNAFLVIQDLITALGNGDAQAVGDLLGRFDSRMDSFLKIRADIGAKMNRVDLAESRLQDMGTNLQNLISKTEDADMAEVITNLKTEENIYTASLAASARLIRPSLVDFLK